MKQAIGSESTPSRRHCATASSGQVATSLKLVAVSRASRAFSPTPRNALIVAEPTLSTALAVVMEGKVHRHSSLVRREKPARRRGTTNEERGTKNEELL